MLDYRIFSSSRPSCPKKLKSCTLLLMGRILHYHPHLALGVLQDCTELAVSSATRPCTLLSVTPIPGCASTKLAHPAQFCTQVPISIAIFATIVNYFEPVDLGWLHAFPRAHEGVVWWSASRAFSFPADCEITTHSLGSDLKRCRSARNAQQLSRPGRFSS